MTDQINTLPVLSVRNLVLFPGVSMPISVGRKQSVAAVEAAWASETKQILIVTQKESELMFPEPDDLHSVGVVATIEHRRGAKRQGYQVLVRADARVNLSNIRIQTDQQAYLIADFDTWPDQSVPGPQAEATLDALLNTTRQMALEILELVPSDTRQIKQLVEGIDDLALLVHLIAEQIDVDVSTKQALLEVPDLKNRALRLLELMQDRKNVLSLQHDIQVKLSEKMSKAQREVMLREQMRAIQEELDDESDAADDLEQQINDAQMPEEVDKLARKELKRLQSLGQNSPETQVIRNYLETVVQMPWQKTTDDLIDLTAAEAVLEADHYGLDKVKKRILEHLAVMKLRGDVRGSILLLVGPPGVGKTSLGRSVAKALGREFVRASLGGVRDEAEIRGHRRTYVGAMPGKIAQSIKRAGVKNPVFLLDEIDKMGTGYGGDPAGALLEVLDPEQNDSFTDHYLDVPFDLSQVFFIATANNLESIPGPLRDRMEVVRLSGYTLAEKLHIAKRHLLPKQLGEHGLTPDQVSVADDALLTIIHRYTREAGVRELQRQLAALSRAAAQQVVQSDGRDLVRVELSDLQTLLGRERYRPEVVEAALPPGVVTGMAWTPVGGDILFIEGQKMPGSGRLTITGQLGDVMKESAQIALSLVRSHLAWMTLDMPFDKTDIHLHVPAGAIPKDGPSAGVTMVTTLASLLTGQSVDPKLAMTGEVTLRGAVMPVGGIKEKVIAAHRAGCTHIILPKDNQKDAQDIPAEVADELDISYVESIEEVLALALGLESGGQRQIHKEAVAADAVNQPC